MFIKNDDLEASRVVVKGGDKISIIAQNVIVINPIELQRILKKIVCVCNETKESLKSQSCCETVKPLSTSASNVMEINVSCRNLHNVPKKN